MAPHMRVVSGVDEETGRYTWTEEMVEPTPEEVADWEARKVEHAAEVAAREQDAADLKALAEAHDDPLVRALAAKLGIV